MNRNTEEWLKEKQERIMHKYSLCSSSCLAVAANIINVTRDSVHYVKRLTTRKLNTIFYEQNVFWFIQIFNLWTRLLLNKPTNTKINLDGWGSHYCIDRSKNFILLLMLLCQYTNNLKEKFYSLFLQLCLNFVFIFSQN